MSIQTFLKDLVGKNEQEVASENVLLKLEIENLRSINETLNEQLKYYQEDKLRDHSLAMKLNQERYDAQQGRLYMMNEGKRIEREAQAMAERNIEETKRLEISLNNKFERRIAEAKLNEIVLITAEIPGWVFAPIKYVPLPIDPNDTTNYDR